MTAAACPSPSITILVCINARPPDNPKGSCGEKGAEALFEAPQGHGARARARSDRVIVNRDELPQALQPRHHRGGAARQRLVRGGAPRRPRGDLRVPPRGGDAGRAPADARHPLGVRRTYQRLRASGLPATRGVEPRQLPHEAAGVDAARRAGTASPRGRTRPRPPVVRGLLCGRTVRRCRRPSPISRFTRLTRDGLQSR